jgi:hypothetical protein
MNIELNLPFVLIKVPVKYQDNISIRKTSAERKPTGNDKIKRFHAFGAAAAGAAAAILKFSQIR